MKRKYSKPVIVFEDFTLSTNIAAGCEWKTNQPGEGYLCGVDPYGDGFQEDFIHMDTSLGCGSIPPGIDDGICYDNPSLDYNVYNS